jgi:hypothetical protein
VEVSYTLIERGGGNFDENSCTFERSVAIWATVLRRTKSAEPTRLLSPSNAASQAVQRNVLMNFTCTRPIIQMQCMCRRRFEIMSPNPKRKMKEMPEAGESDGVEVYLGGCINSPRLINDLRLLIVQKLDIIVWTRWKESPFEWYWNPMAC